MSTGGARRRGPRRAQRPATGGEDAARGATGGGAGSPAALGARAASPLGAVSADDTDTGWGGVERGDTDDERYLRDRPPHW